jgi:hypothetical protein
MYWRRLTDGTIAFATADIMPDDSTASQVF